MARRPITDFDAYLDRLNRFVFRSGLIMKPLFNKARDGEKAGDLCRGRGRAGVARGAGGHRGRDRVPILVGRPDVVQHGGWKRFGLSVGRARTSS